MGKRRKIVFVLIIPIILIFLFLVVYNKLTVVEVIEPIRNSETPNVDIGIRYNNQIYYNVYYYADITGSEQYTYYFPDEELISLKDIVDTDTLPPLPRYKRYYISDCYQISKYDSVENPVIICSYITDLRGEKERWIYYIREDAPGTIPGWHYSEDI